MRIIIAAMILKNNFGMSDYEYLQYLRPTDVAGFYGGLTNTIPRPYELAKLYKSWGITTIAGGQHFVDEQIDDALHNNIAMLLVVKEKRLLKNY